MRFFMHLSYTGTNYSGWQRQKNARSVQAVLEDALSAILKEKIVLFGCGRTDAKVHASQYFAHFNVSKEWQFDLLFRLNKNLPDDISVYEIFSVADASNARYHAEKRTYHYFLHTKKTSILSSLSTLYTEHPLNFEEMGKAINLLTKYQDFLSFCKTPSTYENTLCSLSHVAAYKATNDWQFCFEISANRFLRGMIRAIVSQVIDVGNGKLSLVEFENLLRYPTTDKDVQTAPPDGLFLSEVQYPSTRRAPVFEPKKMLLVDSNSTWNSL